MGKRRIRLGVALGRWSSPVHLRDVRRPRSRSGARLAERVAGPNHAEGAPGRQAHWLWTPSGHTELQGTRRLGSHETPLQRRPAPAREQHGGGRRSLDPRCGPASSGPTGQTALQAGRHHLRAFRSQRTEIQNLSTSLPKEVRFISSFTKPLKNLLD